APPTFITKTVPTVLTASGKGLAAITDRSAITASKPLFILSPWSPSPIAESSAVNSSTCAEIVAATASIKVLGSMFMRNYLSKTPHPGKGRYEIAAAMGLAAVRGRCLAGASVAQTLSAQKKGPCGPSPRTHLASLFLNTGIRSFLGAFIESGEHRIVNLLAIDQLQHHGWRLVTH